MRKLQLTASKLPAIGITITQIQPLIFLYFIFLQKDRPGRIRAVSLILNPYFVLFICNKMFKLNECDLVNGREDQDSDYPEQACMSYEHLLREIKIKSKALTKASNLIEILEAQLQQEQMGRQKQIKEAQERIRATYQIQICELRHEVAKLQDQLTFDTQTSKQLKRKHSRTLSVSGARLFRRSSSKDRSLTLERGNNCKPKPRINTFELDNLKKMILNLSSTQTEIIDTLMRVVEEQKNICHYSEKMGELQKIIERKDPKFGKAKVKKIQNDELWLLIMWQQSIIEGMKTYGSELERQLFQTAQTINKLMQKQVDNKKMSFSMNLSIAKTLKLFEEMRLSLEQLVGENLQLREVIEEMIILLKKKDKRLCHR